MATLIFILYICFFSENNIRVVSRVRSEVKELKMQEEAYKTKINHDSLVVQRLSMDMAAIEEFGRENYYMKAQNEDVYVVRN